MKRLGGIAPNGRYPPFAEQSVRRMVRAAEQPKKAPEGKVLLWPDTLDQLTSHPKIGQAAVEVLEAAGYRGRAAGQARSAAASPGSRPASSRRAKTRPRTLARRAAPQPWPPVRRSSGSSRVARQPCDRMRRTSCRTTPSPPRPPLRRTPCRVSHRGRAGSRHKSAGEALVQTALSPARRRSASTPTGADGERRHQGGSSPTPAAAASQAISASNADHYDVSQGRRGARAAPRRPGRRPADRDPRRRLQLPNPDLSRHRSPPPAPGPTPGRCPPQRKVEDKTCPLLAVASDSPTHDAAAGGPP